MRQSTKTRFDTRISTDQKKLFEHAAQLGGFRSLTDFVVSAAQIHATQIIERHESILASKKDQEIFFNAIMRPPAPNAALKAAAKQYQNALTTK